MGSAATNVGSMTPPWADDECFAVLGHSIERHEPQLSTRYRPPSDSRVIVEETCRYPTNRVRPRPLFVVGDPAHVPRARRGCLRPRSP
jgi:hypothetical protein